MKKSGATCLLLHGHGEQKTENILFFEVEAKYEW
jgi:hypothetical protein